MRDIRGNRISMIFQDPMMTLNPVLTIRTQMVETVLAHVDARGYSSLSLVGSSLGGMVSILAVYQGLNPKTMVLISPATDFKENHSKPRVEDCISNEFYLDTWKRDFYEMAGFIKVRTWLLVKGPRR